MNLGPARVRGQRAVAALRRIQRQLSGRARVRPLRLGRARSLRHWQGRFRPRPIQPFGHRAVGGASDGQGHRHRRGRGQRHRGAGHAPAPPRRPVLAGDHFIVERGPHPTILGVGEPVLVPFELLFHSLCSCMRGEGSGSGAGPRRARRASRARNACTLAVASLIPSASPTSRNEYPIHS